MRTSRISQDTSRIFNALSPNTRSTRSSRSAAKNIATFALGYDGTVEVKQEEQTATLDSTPSVMGDIATPSVVSDIEDVGSPARLGKKRKRHSGSVIKTEHKSTLSSPRKRRNVKQEEDEEHKETPTDIPEYADDAQDDTDSPQARRKSQPKLPAKRSTSPGGTLRYKPPSNWDTIYDMVKDFRAANPTAPVDTMGCEDLFWQAAPAAQQRYHTLTALMLSSQTKDTVTAAAMQRLHTELLPNPPLDSSTSKPLTSSLTIANILAADPVHLNALISKVGFHNTKTKHIQLVAQILHDRYNNDIPSTIPDLISLPGVGPKMAYLCMSAAWHQDVGIGVDVHVHRITNLWGWHVTKTPEQTREWLEGWLPHNRWHHINKMLVGLGQTVCLPVGRRCGECPLAGGGLCKGEIRGWTKKESKKKARVKMEMEKVEIDIEQKSAVFQGADGNLIEETKVEN